MRTDRLLRLADLLEADANNPTGVKFDLGHWATSAEHAEALDAQEATFDVIQKKRFKEGIKEIPVNCNTAACAMGLAAISGAFKDEGLSWTLFQCRNGTGELLPTLGTLAGFAAAARLFDIDSNTTFNLFDPSYYDVIRGKKAELAVADRIRSLVNGTWKPQLPDDNGDE